MAYPDLLLTFFSERTAKELPKPLPSMGEEISFSRGFRKGSFLEKDLLTGLSKPLAEASVSLSRKNNSS
jgi:hypothetical protein